MRRDDCDVWRPPTQITFIVRRAYHWSEMATGPEANEPDAPEMVKIDVKVTKQQKEEID